MMRISRKDAIVMFNRCRGDINLFDPSAIKANYDISPKELADIVRERMNKESRQTASYRYKNDALSDGFTVFAP